MREMRLTRKAICAVLSRTGLRKQDARSVYNSGQWRGDAREVDLWVSRLGSLAAADDGREAGQTQREETVEARFRGRR